ncbi:hypothetical protein SSBR45G_16840 [Bradyrhizobium sp. SSBR45G]|uniref:hypothetical protein n=1 Tax=unclassified Bradyrhizobium TaxID=2631580 RepID=UPI0023429675|nr:MULTISPECIES: hypothetical protein [unclassified Bradyrhizobium]GLH76776.1 hypothetical protein SSBR45G_16840 [Bradyrhizobium sp. SSBR45G]GLH83534.1 hypothetical protein SSBR45R_09940 [Bradyrhizobium sp. SSBR45R]
MVDSSKLRPILSMRSVRRLSDLSDTNRLLREQVVSLLIEIELLRELAECPDLDAEPLIACPDRKRSRNH